MRLLLFRSLWTTGGDTAAALADCEAGLFDGVEGPLPELAAARAAGVPLIAEITTGGGYVPTTRSVQAHVEDYRRKLEAAADLDPLFATVLAGCDAWTLDESVDFFGQAMAFAEETGIAVSFETHRSRATFTPWGTAALLEALPALRLTCDFSHWCCVCERLVMDEEPALLARCAAQAMHIHARVGYDQGPQVPHPAAPEFASALAAHERWWAVLWRARLDAGAEFLTMTPEFGPDGYLHCLPFTAAPVASLDEVNRWMARRQRESFAAFTAAA